jgi:hypothetical protein
MEIVRRIPEKDGAAKRLRQSGEMSNPGEQNGKKAHG